MSWWLGDWVTWWQDMIERDATTNLDFILMEYLTKSDGQSDWGTRQLEISRGEQEDRWPGMIKCIWLVGWYLKWKLVLEHWMGKFQRKNRILVFGFKPEGRVGDYQIKKVSRFSFCIFLVPVTCNNSFELKNLIL